MSVFFLYAIMFFLFILIIATTRNITRPHILMLVTMLIIPLMLIFQTSTIGQYVKVPYLTEDITVVSYHIFQDEYLLILGTTKSNPFPRYYIIDYEQKEKSATETHRRQTTAGKVGELVLKSNGVVEYRDKNFSNLDGITKPSDPEQ